MTHQQTHRPQSPARPRGIGAGADLLDSPGPDYDALADLFLGESERRAQPGPAPAGARTLLTLVPSDYEDAEEERPEMVDIEGLIIGHLPVLASAWVTQYARHVAEETASWVGLLRLRAGYASVELVGPPAARGVPDEPSVRVCDSLDGAIEQAARVAGRWIIRVDEVTESRIAELAAIDRATLLTGADEAAVVASYRTLKLLSDRCGDDEAPRLGVAIMGADEEKAREACARLAHTVRTHLGRDLPLAACVARIGPGRSIGLYRGESRDPAESVLQTALDLIRSAPRTVAQTPGTPRDTRPSAASAATAAPALVPAPTPAPSHRSTVASGLARHLPGLIPLPAPCPVAPAVELAVDAAGRVHALAPAAVQGALDQLLAASAWTGTHADWIRLAAPHAAGGDAAMHLFTDEPAPVRRLLDSGVRVHLLVRVTVKGEDAWVCRSLN